MEYEQENMSNCGAVSFESEDSPIPGELLSVNRDGTEHFSIYRYYSKQAFRIKQSSFLENIVIIEEAKKQKLFFLS